MRTPGQPKVALAILLLAATLGAGSGFLQAEESTADVTYVVKGLTQPAEIIVDHWGVPHIYAGTHYEAFFVQGFNAARDRLWQIDTWRRRGLGQLSAVLGGEYVAQDRAARLLLYRGEMYAEWLAYGSDAKRIAESFTNGINAFVHLTREQPDLLPPEFHLLDYQPALWEASDVVRIRSNGLWRNVRTEVKRAQIACAADLHTASLWKVLEPAWTTDVPEGLDPCDIPADVLRDYDLATKPVTFHRGKPGSVAKISTREAQPLVSQIRDGVGSNNWVVAPARTDTGRPILADDPHRGHAVPSLRYISHLTAPGLDVIGAGEPALPGISIGHNQQIAFGLTIFPIDQEDLYVYSKRRGGYRYNGKVTPLTHIEDKIAVRDGPPQYVNLSFTKHGPVIHETDKQLFVLRAAWLEPGMAPYFGSIEYMRAQNWREFSNALNRWGAPSENQVYADTDGNIGYKPAGRFPRRHNWDGLLPVPGDGRYEWDGYFDMDVLPEEYNPPRGFTGTANSMNLPADYPISSQRIGFEWSAPWRYRRLWEVLESQPHHSLIDSHDLQRDYLSILAREVLNRLPPTPPTTPETASTESPEAAETADTADTTERAKTAATATTANPDQPALPELSTEPIPSVPGPALAMMQSWDAVLTPNSAPAALFAIWYYRHLGDALAAYLAPEVADLIVPLDSYTVLDALSDPAGQEVALNALESAWQETILLLGDNPDDWRWGDLHHIRFQHPLQQLAPTDLKAKMSYAPYPRGGSGNSTNNTSFSANDFLVRAGASFRMVLDVGRWDDAEMTNAPGQSGNPDSPFYRNLLKGWAEDSSFPLLYSKEAVVANQALKIQLIPDK